MTNSTQDRIREEQRKKAEQAKRLRRELGQWLRDLRVDKDLSQMDVAGQVGFAYYSNVSDIENGKTRIPAARTRDWARALGVPVDLFAKRLLQAYEPELYECIFKGKKDAKDNIAG